MLSPLDLLLAGLAGFGGGFVNAIAGGGTLVTFPSLVALGIPPVAANMTSTIALCPGYLGATLAQRRDLQGQRPRLIVMIPAAIGGGIAGAVLLTVTRDATFRALVPWLILLAAALLAMQDRIRALVLSRREHGTHTGLALTAVAASSVYGGYFGAGMSVIVLAALAITLSDTLTRLNALKQALGLATNAAAASFLAFSGRPVWPAVLVMAVGAILGGATGGRMASVIKPRVLRSVIVTAAVVIAVAYLL